MSNPTEEKLANTHTVDDLNNTTTAIPIITGTGNNDIQVSDGNEAQVPLSEPEVIIDDSETESITNPEPPKESTASKTDDIKKEETKNVRSNQNTTLVYPTQTEGQLPSGDSISLPSDFSIETKKSVDKLPNIQIIDSEETWKWGQVAAEGLDYTTINESFVSTLEDPKSDFSNGLDVNGVSLLAAPPKFKSEEGQNLKGDRAIIRLLSHLGMGSLFQVPLWHSGIWITFKPPTESEIIELNRLLISDKIQLGRYTYGLAYTNSTSYTVGRLVNFALSHVYNTSIKMDDITPEKLMEHISCQDLHSLLWGFACTMYPKGFNYRRACVSDPEKCNKVEEAILNISKLQWTNRSVIGDKQKAFMSNRQSKIRDLDSIKNYQEELSSTQDIRKEINTGDGESIYMTIKTPTIAQYIEAGYRWIDDIVDTVEKALGVDPKDSDRDKLINSHSKATMMRQYCHWVKSIEVGTNIIDDKDTIERTLNELSADDVIRQTFIDDIFKYINESTISIIGIPMYDCPSCGVKQESAHTSPKHVNIIPLDVIQVFIGLLTQRLSRITNR